jgi:hypothetical protein
LSRRILITVVLVAVCAAGGLGATTAWESKPFNAWTDAELNSLLTSSPWAGPGSISRIKKDGTLAKTGDAVVISWTTALPMREAVARERIGLNGSLTKEMEAFLAEPAPLFIVAVKVTGSAEARALAGRAGTSQVSTHLTPRGKTPIIASFGEGHPIDAAGKVLPDGAAAAAGSVLAFAFSRNSAISARDREVEFVSQLNDVIIKRTFHINDMVYKGKLEL